MDALNVQLRMPQSNYYKCSLFKAVGIVTRCKSIRRLSGRADCR